MSPTHSAERVGLFALTAALVACAARPPVSAPNGWLPMTREQRCSQLFATMRGGARLLRTNVAQLRFVELGPGALGGATPVTGVVNAGLEPRFSPRGSASSEPTPWLFVHGLGGGLGDFAPVLMLAAREHHVFAVDLPGFGGSVSLEADYSIHAHVRALRSFAAAIGVERFHLVCHSLGGQVCLALALEAPAMVASLTLVDAAGTYDQADFLEEKTGGALGVLRPSHDPAIYAITGGDMEIVDRLLSGDPFVLSAIASFKESYRGRLRDLSVPTLIVWGAADPLLPLRYGVHMKENIAGSRLRVVPNAQHWPQLSHPSVVFDAIVALHRDLVPRSLETP